MKIKVSFPKVQLKKIIAKRSLVPRASFRYNRKVKKRSWNTSNTWSKFAQIEGFFLRKIWEYMDGATENINSFMAKSLYV